MYFCCFQNFGCTNIYCTYSFLEYLNRVSLVLFIWPKMMWRIVTLYCLLCTLLLYAQSEADLTSELLQDNTTTCPTWTYWKQSKQACVCGDDYRRTVSCDVIGNYYIVRISKWYCLTLDATKTREVIGACRFSLNSSRRLIPRNSSLLQSRMCDYVSRTGQLCGRCQDGSSPPVYSYYPQCVHCPEGTNNWPKYLAVSLLPTTLFFLVTVALRFRATSPHLAGYIMFCQLMASPPILRYFASSNFKHPSTRNSGEVSMKVLASFFSIWNLDFFRIVYSPFCLQHGASTLQILSLDYLIATYPLALIVLTYILVTLHYYDNRLVVWIWRPFRKCFIRFRRKWDIQNSLVDAFATFLLLSYVKLLSVSFDILMPTPVVDKWGNQVSTVLYYDGSITYFGREHLPYALTAIFVLVVFTFLPILLLLLYPCKCFQTFLNRAHCRSQALHAFIEAFQGCFNDGTDGGRDCRYFAALYLLIRVLAYLSLGLLIIYSTIIFIVLLFVTVILLISTFRPYKRSSINIIEIVFLSQIMIVSVGFFRYSENIYFVQVFEIIVGILMLLFDIAYPLCVTLWLIKNRSIRLQAAVKSIRQFFTNSQSRECSEDFLPPRVLADERSTLLSVN